MGSKIRASRQTLRLLAALVKGLRLGTTDIPSAGDLSAIRYACIRSSCVWNSAAGSRRNGRPRRPADARHAICIASPPAAAPVPRRRFRALARKASCNWQCNEAERWKDPTNDDLPSRSASSLLLFKTSCGFGPLLRAIGRSPCKPNSRPSQRQMRACSGLWEDLCR